MASVTKTYSNTSEQPTVIYRTEVTISRVSATKVKVAVSCDTRLGSSGSWLGTGHKLVGHIWFDGKDHTWTIKGSASSWTGDAWHENSGNSWTISAGPEVTSVDIKLKFVNTYGTAGDIDWQKSFSVGVNSGVEYATSDHSSIEIIGEANSQANAKVELLSIPLSVGYTRVICWYRGDEYIGYTAVSETSHSNTFEGFLPNTTYKLTAEIRIGSIDGDVIFKKSVSITTPQETGKLALTPKSTYITAHISEMFDTPNYERVLEFYIKKDEDSEYALVASVAAQGTTGQANLTGLISNSRYDVKVLIKNGGTTLRTFTDSVETIADLSLIPTADIESISQQLGTRLCTITWITDKAVAGTTYVIEAKADGEWYEFASMSDVISPVTVELDSDGMGNADVTFRIRSVNESVAEGLVNYSEEFVFYVRDDFLWDSDKIAGKTLIITANEWNRLREYAIARNSDRGNTVDIPIVRKNDAITAAVYNNMKNAISLVTPLTIADKRRGDAITAADIDALRVAINTVA